MKKKNNPDLKIISINRKASINYLYESIYEVGIMITGAKIQSKRIGKINKSA